MFNRIVGKPKAKETDGKPRYNKAMPATSATKSDNGKMYCLSAKCSDAQATEPGSCPLELLDSPEPEFKVTAHGYGSVGNSFIAINFKNCYTLHERAKQHDRATVYDTWQPPLLCRQPGAHSAARSQLAHAFCR